MNTDTINNPLAILFGDLFNAVERAKARCGSQPLPFLLIALAHDLDATAGNLADLWKVEFKQPVDYAMIELVLAMSNRMKNSWWYRTKTIVLLRCHANMT